MKIRCPHCQNAIELVGHSAETSVACPSCGSLIELTELLSASPGATRPYHAPPQLRPGDKINQYEILHKLGVGGFGAVFAAHDTSLDRRVAIKVPRTTSLTHEQAEVFIREARTAAQLQHANIVSVHEVWRSQEMIYIVSDMIEGCTLAEWMHDRKPSPAVSAQLIITLCRAMARAHLRGIVHRDLKPRNILMDADGNPHITDFGLAQWDHPEEPTTTVEGEILGTPAYMSPEQALGRAVDHRCDVYSLGVILYEMLTGRRPFMAGAQPYFQQMVDGVYAPPRMVRREIPRDLEGICMKAMSRLPEHRFSATEFADDLQRFLDGDSTLTQPMNWVGRFVVTLNRRRAAAAIGFLAAAVIVLAVWAFAREQTLLPLNTPQLTTVEIVTTPPRAEIWIVPIDFGEGRLRSEDRIQAPAGNGKSTTLQLAPGWYQLKCILPGFGSQTVWREVPANAQQRHDPLGYRATTWRTTTRGSIQLHPVVIRQILVQVDNSATTAGDIKLVRVPRGVFGTNPRGRFSAVYRDRLPQPGSEMPQFLLGQSEVTVGQFRRVMGYAPQPMKDRLGPDLTDRLPVTNVCFLEALEFCERVGCRLPTLEEYLFAATRGGTQPTPWGGNPRRLTEWTYDAEKARAFDRTHTAPPIFNLYSSTVEWSASLYFPVDRTGSRDTWPQQFIEDTKKSRVIVGGTLAVAQKKPLPTDWINGPWVFAPCLHYRKDVDALGFRVAQSLNEDPSSKLAGK